MFMHRIKSQASSSSLTNPLLGPTTQYSLEGHRSQDKEVNFLEKSAMISGEEGMGDNIRSKALFDEDLSVKIRAFSKYILHLRVNLCNMLDIYVIEACNKVSQAISFLHLILLLLYLYRLRSFSWSYSYLCTLPTRFLLGQ